MSGRFIPEIFARRGEGSDESDGEDSEEGFTGTAQKKRKALVETDKGALFHKYDKSVHEWVTHLRHVHPEASSSGHGFDGGWQADKSGCQSM